MYYIINKRNRVIGTSDYELNLDDLSSRGEFVIESAVKMIDPYYDGEKLIEKGEPPTESHIFNHENAKWIYNLQYSVTEKRFDTLGADCETHGEGWFFVDSETTENGIKDSLTSGQIWVENGKLHYSGAAPSEAHSFNLKTKQWTIDTGKQAALLVKAKMQKLAEINSTAQNFVRQVAKLDETPEFEQQTWQEQANEARAWFADKSHPTPKLDLLAQLRGVPADILRQKCYEKAQAFYQLSFAVAGQRQRYEDALKACETLEQVQAVTPEFTLNLEG
ncbi:hypothetical protein NYR72_01825 [Actinobacillus equuli subsp. haemolyticus]|uniref:hypothetical protein n=1 Tax=Actinobacillus equuli TaxID=718 RepID=UPI00241894CC|nr:hypothetical protein [Actinobacillus equuli]MDG4947389.1 hypothetical protein [Actinobacillus equuli subsp. haemolyticus]